MKLKKFMSLALALVMAMALAVPALASAPTFDNDDNQQTTFTGGTTTPTLKVTVLGAAYLVFNPYKLEAKMQSTGQLRTTGSDASDTTVNDQIISKAFQIKNQTNVPVRMGVVLGAKAACSTEGGEVASIAKSAPAASVTAKQVYVYADFAVFDGDAAALEKRPDAWLTSQRLTATEATITGTGNDASWDGTSGGKMEVKAGAGGIYVPKPTVPATAGQTDYQNSIWVKLGGAATPTPTNTWSDADTLNVYMALKFVTLGTVPTYKLRAGATDSSATTTSVSPVAFAATEDGANSTPTFTIPSRNANLNVAWAATGESAAIWETDEANIVGDIEAGTVVTIHAPKNLTTGNASYGKKGEITVPVFYNVDGTKNTSVKATQTNTKDKTSDWTFTMPAQHIYVMMTVQPSPANAE